MYRILLSTRITFRPDAGQKSSVFYIKSPQSLGEVLCAVLCWSYAVQEPMSRCRWQLQSNTRWKRETCGRISGLMRKPCATKTFLENGRSCAIKTCIRPCIRLLSAKCLMRGLMRFLGFLRKVLCEPYARFV